MKLRRDSPDAPDPWSSTWSSSASQETPSEVQSRHEGPRRTSRIREIWPLLTLWLFIAIFAILYSVYIYKSLLSDDPAIGNLLPSASDTNLVVSILSQVLANSVDMLLLGVFDVLRWQLAARFPGISAVTFFQLSSSTQWIPMFFLTIGKLSGGGIGFIRLLLPLLGLYFGSVLKYRAEFVYYFKEAGGQTGIFAGSGLPMDESLLALIPASYVGIFYISWIPTLLDIPKFAKPMPIDGCNEGCTSSFLPGGVETARKLAPYLNMTLMEGGVFRDAETIKTYNAPGILLRFDNLPESFDFDRARECHTYGDYLNDTLQVCIRPMDGSLAFGWQACPTRLYTTSACTNDTSWLADPLPKKVLMTRYKQYATTAFDGRDFSILNVQPTSDPIQEHLNATTYLAILNKLYKPPASDIGTTPASSFEHDVSVGHAVTYATTWLLRLYDDVFPDDTHTPLLHLRNFLAIPQQFMATCLHFANYTVPADLPGFEGRFALPDDMRTFAASGRSTTRLLALDWVVWVYVASTAVVVIAVGAVVITMMTREEGIPESSGFVEVDLAARFDRDEGDCTAEGARRTPYADASDHRDSGDALRPIRELGRPEALRATMSSSFRVARELRKRKIRVVSVSSSSSSGSECRFDGTVGDQRSFAFREGVHDRRGGASGIKGLDALERVDTDLTRVASPRLKW